MLERIIFKDEEDSSFLKLFVEVFIIFIVLCFVNVLVGGNYLFLVALTSISIVYPVVKFIRRQNHLELLSDDMYETLGYFDRQVLVTWIIFIAAALSFLITFSLIRDYSFQSSVLEKITGNFTAADIGFNQILLNNLYVAFLTFIIAFISTSGIVFVLVWNASILALVVAQAPSFVQSFGLFFGYISHGLLEIAGFVLIGLAASILSYRIERYKRYNRHANKYLLNQFSRLFLFGIVLILVAAVIEVI